MPSFFSVRASLPLALATAITVAVTGCSSPPASAAGTIRIVASTDVYGSLAETIGGRLVQVTSIIDDPSQDPHSYEGSARTQLELSRADIVIENGGGYDSFVDTLLAGVDNPKATVLNAADISGYARGDGFNEHLWYDFPSMKNVVAELVTTMSLRDAANSETYSTNGEKVTAALDALIAREGTLASKHPGVGVAITEPVPLYLLQASGFDNRTPLEFTTAIEDGTDVAASVLQQTLALFRDKRVSLLVYNKQTTGAETEKLKAAAKDAAIPVVGVTETLPAGEDYLSWMGANLDAIEKALS